MSNQEAADSIRQIKDARSAAKHLTEEALIRKSSDDISCIVVRFQWPKDCYAHCCLVKIPVFKLYINSLGVEIRLMPYLVPY